MNISKEDLEWAASEKLLIIYLGIKYQRNRKAIEAAILNSLPDGLKNLRPTAR